MNKTHRALKLTSSDIVKHFLTIQLNVIISFIGSEINMVEVQLSSWGKSGHCYERNSLPGEAYLQMSEQNIIPALENIFYDEEAYYVQQDGSPPHYHRVVRAFLITTFLSNG